MIDDHETGCGCHSCAPRLIHPSDIDMATEEERELFRLRSDNARLRDELEAALRRCRLLEERIRRMAS